MDGKLEVPRLSTKRYAKYCERSNIDDDGGAKKV
jgi:hypothetical protein